MNGQKMKEEIQMFDDSQKLDVRNIPLDQIEPSPLNPRGLFPEKSMRELMKSIEGMDVLEPLVVRRYKDGYQIVCGERRYKALKRLGRGYAPCIVRDMDDEQTIIAMLQENLQREPFNPIEEARGYEQLMDLAYTQQQIAEAVGQSQTTVCQRLKLLNLHEDLQNKVLRNDLPVRKARLLADISDQDVQLMLEDVVREKRWNAAQLGRYAACFTDGYEQLTFDGSTDYEEAVMQLREDRQMMFDPELEASVELNKLAGRYTSLETAISRQARFLEGKGEAACTLMGLKREGFVVSLSAAREATERLSQQLENALCRLQYTPKVQSDEDSETDDGQSQQEAVSAEAAGG
jgi:ParB family chromosome partitioning protein